MPGDEFWIKKSSSRVHVDRWLDGGRIEEISADDGHNPKTKTMKQPTSDIGPGMFTKGPKKTATVASRKPTNTTAARSDTTRSNAQPAAAPLTLQAVSDNLHELLRAAVRAAGVKDEAAFRKLPKEEQNAFLAQARGQAAMPLRDGVQMLDPKRCRRSPFNRKIDVNSPKFLHLLSKIKTQGVLQNGIVRPVHGDPNYDFEVIAGERRWLCAGLAKQMFPAVVRECDDTEAIELQMTENLDRDDLNPIDEATKYEQLLQRYTTEEKLSKAEAMKRIEVRSGRKESTIYARLKLLELPPTAMEAVEKGIIPASHAELITKLKTPEAQAALTAQILTPKREYSSAERDYVDVPLSFREAKEIAARASEEEEKEQKWQATTKEYRDKSFKVLSLKDSGSVFNYARLKANYVGVNDKCDLDPKQRTWKALLGAHAPTTVVAYNSYDTNKVRLVFPRKAAEKALKLAGHESLVDSGGTAEKGLSAEEKRKREQAKREEEQKIKRAIDTENIAKVVAAAEAKEPNADFFRLIIAAICDDQGIEEKLIERRQIPVLEKDGWQKQRIALKRFAEKADGKTLRGLLLECFLYDWDGANDEVLSAAARLYKVKLQTSGKKKGGADAEDEDEE